MNPVDKMAHTRRLVKELGISDFLSPRQRLHLPPVTDGRSVLTLDADALLRELVQGSFELLRCPKPGHAIFDFVRPIGEFWSVQSGRPELVGRTQFGSVLFGKNGSHIIPANPNQR